MAQAGTYNIIIEKGTTFSFSATFKNANGSAVNLTNLTLKSEIRRKWDNTLLAEFTETKTDSTKGIASFSLTAAQTSALTNDESHYDIFSTNSVGGAKDRLLQGSVTIVENITSP